MKERQERERAFHNSVFAESDGGARTTSFYAITQAAVMAYRAAVMQPGSSRALEYGCGPTGLACNLADRGVCVTGIDISDVAVKISSERALAEGLADRANFCRMDAEKLDFSSESFDLIFGASILHHLDLSIAIPELGRVMARSGRAVFLEPLGHNPFINAYRRLTPNARTADEHPLTRRELRQLEESFESVNVRYFCLTSLLAIPLHGRPGFHMLLRRLDGVDRRLFRTMRSARSWAWIVVLELAGRRGARASRSSAGASAQRS